MIKRVSPLLATLPCFLLLGLVTAPLLGGCANKGREILTEAETQYLAGKTLAASETLKRVAVEAPDTPEVAEAHSLAIEWLSKKANLEHGESKRDLLLAGLEWAPEDPDLLSPLCEVQQRLKDWDAARACLKKVEGRIAPSEHARLSEVLAEHDRVVSESAERETLLQSENPLDWYSLMARFPESDEATSAAQKLPDASLCADLKRFAGHLQLTGAQVGPTTWAPRLQEQKERSDQLSILSTIRREATDLLDSLAKLEAELGTRAMLEDEAPASARLIEGYVLVRPPVEKLLKSFEPSRYKMEDRLANIDRFGRTFGELVKQVEERREAAELICQGLGR